MKTSAVLLTVSIAANVALATAFYLRPPVAETKRSAPTYAADNAAKSGTGAQNNETVRNAIESGDLAALQAAGFSADVARDLVAGRALARLLEKDRATRPTSGRWWSTKGAGKRTREDELKAQREFSDAMIAAFGEDPFFGGSKDATLAFLPAGKRDILRRITQDYAEMLAKFGGEGVQLASDREKQKMLRTERDRDIAAQLSPEECAEYQMRTSATAAAMIQRYGDAIASEDDFRKIYNLQKAFEEKYPPLNGRITPDMMSARAEAARQLQDDIRAAVGDDQYAALRRASDGDLRTLDSLASRLNLAPDATDRIVAARDSFAAESQRINADTSITPAQRRAQIQELGNRARSEVMKTLGTEATDVYAQRSAWLNMLQGGMAFSTTPQANSPGALTLAGGSSPSVFPVMPAGVAGGGVRQMVVNGISTNDVNGGARDAGFFVAPGGGPLVVPRENMQVMTFTTATSEIPAAPVPATPAPTQPTPKP